MHLQITGGQLNGVSPNYRSMGPGLRALTAISYNRWAVEAVTTLEFQAAPQFRLPTIKAVMNQAGT